MKARILCCLAAFALAAPAQVLYAPKAEPGAYTAPHRPITRIAELKAKYKDNSSWRELIVDDKHLRSEYIFAQPGHRHPRAVHPDTRAWWVVMEGEVRFDIESVEPFTARKGSMVQVPMQTMFSFEVVGQQPALIFETNIAGARTLYADQNAAPEIPGFGWVPVKFPNRVVGKYLHNNKPHIHFDDVAQGIETGKLKGTIRIVEDDRGTANFIYGYNSKMPPLNEENRGHYHPEGAEYWLIMKGQIRYPIERVGVIVANEGDVVYVPPFTFHAPRWWGDGASCRLAMNGFPHIAHLFDPD